MGFALILFLTVISTYITYDALNKTASGFDDYRDMARDSNLMSQVESSLLLTRTSAKDYFIRSSKEDIALFDSHYKHMRAYLDEAKKEVNGVDNTRDIDALEMGIKNYFKGFKQVVYYTNQKRQLIDDELNIKGPKIASALPELLNDIYDIPPNKQSFGLAKEVSALIDYFFIAQINSLQFFDSHQDYHFQVAKAQFAKVGIVVQNHISITEEPLLNERYIQLVNEIYSYEEILDEIYKLSISRTRSIHLIDEAGPEMSQLTQQVKQNIISIQDELGPAQVKANKDSFSFIMTVLLVLISSIVIIAISIPKQIMRGLKSLKEGVGSFLIYLNKEALEVELIEIDGRNEFSEIASSLNENILVTKEKLRQTEAFEEKSGKSSKNRR